MLPPSILSECGIIFVLTLLFLKLIRSHAQRLGIIDIPNPRSTHTKHTPRAGGIGFFFAIVFITLIFHLDLLLTYIWTFLAIFMVFAIGVIDDRYTVTPRMKLIIIILATFLLYLDDIVIYEIGTFFGLHISLGWVALPFTIFSVVSFTNAFNLIDGIDGLSSTLGIIILSALLSIGYVHNDSFIVIISLFFIIALLAFLVFNWHPASIFMGDSGSLTLGFVISVLSIKALAYIPAISILFLTAIPILDTLYVIIRRKINKRSAFAPDKCHIHHLINLLFKGNMKKTVLTLGLIQFIYTMFGLFLSKNIDEGILLVFFIANLFLVYKFFSEVILRLKLKC